MASKGKQLAEGQPAEDLPYLDISDLMLSKRNSRVTVIEANDKKNNQGYMFLVFLDSNKGSKRRSKAIIKHQDSDGHFTWFELHHNVETGWPYLGKRTTEVDEYNLNPDDAPSEPQMDIDEDLKQEEQRDSQQSDNVQSTHHQHYKYHLDIWQCLKQLQPRP